MLLTRSLMTSMLVFCAPLPSLVKTNNSDKCNFYYTITINTRLKCNICKIKKKRFQQFFLKFFFVFYKVHFKKTMWAARITLVLGKICIQTVVAILNSTVDAILNTAEFKDTLFSSSRRTYQLIQTYCLIGIHISSNFTFYNLFS
jgi:hypothetical protein